ncbi:DinB family protein [Nonomuraea aurantiaca]|uniref:DinB family protein n=1 Tax=Nonomuraea aurantiaca TaxID=2878562 RepID=UPI003558F979
MAGALAGGERASRAVLTAPADPAAAPTVERLTAFRDTVAERVHARMNDIAGGRVTAPGQLTVVARHLLVALINHEYQHDQWIGEVRAHDLGHALPPDPGTGQVSRLDGYLVLNPLA